VVATEITKKLRIVTVLKEGEQVKEEFLHEVQVLDKAYDTLDVEFIQLHDVFGPELVHRLSAEWRIPTNFMFIGSPGDKFPYRIAELGGVRLVI